MGKKEKQTAVPKEKKERERTPAEEFRPLFIVVTIVCALIFAAGLLFGGRYVVNAFYNFAYAKGYYMDRSATTKMLPKLYEEHVAFHNTGNNDYQNGRYEQAVNNYMQALEQQPPHETEDENGRITEDCECDTRINLALSLLKRIDFKNLHLSDREEVDAVIEQLLVAREVLTAENCAGFDTPTGHSPDAEQLKKEIDEVLKRLNYEPPPPQSQPQEGEDDQNQNNEENQNNDSQSRREQELERRLNEEMSDAKEEQERQNRAREREREGGAGSGGYGGQNNVQAW